jgi:hypothetical protein
MIIMEFRMLACGSIDCEQFHDLGEFVLSCHNTGTIPSGSTRLVSDARGGLQRWLLEVASLRERGMRELQDAPL